MAIDKRTEYRLALTARFEAVLKEPNVTIQGPGFVCQVCRKYKATRAHAIAEHCLAHVRKDELEPIEDEIDWEKHAQAQADAEAKVRAGLRPLELD